MENTPLSYAPRVTRVGKLIRRLSIDELPQLINVLRSEMSLVGPRPNAEAHDLAFYETVANYAFRHHVKPGLTGSAQIHGCRGELRNTRDVEERVRLGLWYIRNWRHFLDFKIIVITAVTLPFSKNAYRRPSPAA